MHDTGQSHFAMSSMPHRPPPSTSAPRPSRLWWLAALALAGLLAALFQLANLVWQDSKNSQRDTLVQDVLWSEQALRLHFTSLQEWGNQLLGEIQQHRLDAESFRRRSAFLMRENRDVVQVEWLGADDQRLWQVGERLPASPALLDTARRLATPRYGAVYRHGHERFVDLALPAFAADGMPRGTLRLTIELHALLQSQIPWWIAEKYQLSLVDLGDNVIASRSALAEPVGTLSHEIELTPPGGGMRLRATSYITSLGVALPLLAVLSTLLTVLLLVSLWKIRQHMRHRHQSEDALRAEVTFRTQIEDSMRNGLFVLAPDGTIERANRAFCTMTGLTEAELLGQVPPYRFWPDGQPEQLAALRDGALPADGFELTWRHVDGTPFDVRLFVAPLAGSTGGWLATCYDRTEMNRRRQAIIDTELRFRTVLDGLDAPVGVAAADGQALVFANRALLELLPDLHPDVSEPFCLVIPGLDRLRDEPASEHDIQFHGSAQLYHLHRRRIAWVDGESAWLSIFTDVTESRRLAEREREHSERVQSTSRLLTMGELASTLAHEINQPLAAIASFASGSVRKLENDELSLAQAGQVMGRIADQARRAGKVIQGIRSFVRQREPALAPTLPQALLDSVLTLVGPRLRQQQIAVTRRVSANLPLDIDAVLIEQVLLNLLNNAADALQDAAPHGRGWIEIRVDAEDDGQRLRFEVTDNGPGLSGDLLGQLATPFYTTKIDGMGIGLSICRSIVEYHRGAFGYRPADSGGSCFWFVLPLSAAHDKDPIDD